MTKAQMSATIKARVERFAAEADQDWPNLYPNENDRNFYRALANARAAVAMDLKRELGL